MLVDPRAVLIALLAILVILAVAFYLTVASRGVRLLAQYRSCSTAA
jgi:hypothetical protein